jgi:hypothetical protein
MRAHAPFSLYVVGVEVTICPDSWPGLGCQVSDPSSPWWPARSRRAWCQSAKKNLLTNVYF